MLLLVALAAAAPPAALPPEDWESMIDRVVPAIVTIRVAGTRSFDTEGASSSTATGFVVDAKRGILLTNRHVVQPGHEGIVAMAAPRVGLPEVVPLTEGELIDPTTRNSRVDKRARTF